MMSKKARCYYSKAQIEFRLGSRVEARILLNSVAGELSYQEFDSHGDVKINNGITLDKKQIEEVLPYINTDKYEPYRNLEDSISDDGVCGYFDEIDVYFTGISDSPVPLINISMNMIHDDKHLWPTERLLKYLCRTYFSGKEYKTTFIYGMGK